MIKIKNKKHCREFSQAFVEDLAKSKKDQALYLQIALEDYHKDKDLGAFLLALRTIAKASGGVSDVARKTNLNRQSIYRALSLDGNPAFSTIDSILNSFGFTFTIKKSL